MQMRVCCIREHHQRPPERCWCWHRPEYKQSTSWVAVLGNMWHARSPEINHRRHCMHGMPLLCASNSPLGLDPKACLRSHFIHLCVFQHGGLLAGAPTGRRALGDNDHPALRHSPLAPDLFSGGHNDSAGVARSRKSRGLRPGKQPARLHLCRRRPQPPSAAAVRRPPSPLIPSPLPFLRWET